MAFTPNIKCGSAKRWEGRKRPLYASMAASNCAGAKWDAKA